MSTLPHQSNFYIPNRAALLEFAQALATCVHPGDVLALDGNLGAGKTTLSQCLGQALGLTETVSSPTFVLMNEYVSGAYPILHVDLYRLGPENSESLSEELFSAIHWGKSLILVEWACYGSFLKDAVTLHLEISYVDEHVEARRIQVNSNRMLNLPKTLSYRLDSGVNPS